MLERKYNRICSPNCEGVHARLFLRKSHTRASGDRNFLRTLYLEAAITPSTFTCTGTGMGTGYGYFSLLNLLSRPRFLSLHRAHG